MLAAKCLHGAQASHLARRQGAAAAPTGTHRPTLLVRSAPELRAGETAATDAGSKTGVAEPAKVSPMVSPVGSAASVGSMDGMSAADIVAAANRKNQKRARQADSTDAISTFLTRRFGIAGGLAWLGFLAVGSLGEQVKTRLEVASEANGTKEVEDAPEVVLPSGVRYRDLRVGGGSAPIKGYLTVLDYTATANGEQFESTRARGKPIVFLYGGRPYTGGMCAGLEQALSSMKAGGRRIVTVPPELGFGERGAMLRPTEHVPEKQGVVPPGATLVYDVDLLRVSIPPS